MIRDIVAYPDERLRQVSLPIVTITPATLELADDLLQTMLYGERLGIGLAAPQVGELVRMFVLGSELEGGRIKRYVCMNPEILERRGSIRMREACFSFERRSYVTIERAAEVKLIFFDRKSERQTKWFRGIEAVCVQHEVDHLDGKLMVDYGKLEGTEEAIA